MTGQAEPSGWLKVKVRVVDLAADLFIEFLCLPPRVKAKVRRRP